jgi:hypothetical protein
MRRMQTMGTFLLLALAAGCSTVDVTGLRGTMLPGETPIQTDADSYTLREQGGGLATEIDIRFENRTGRTIYVVNCHGSLAPVLEKRVGNEWVPYWRPAQLMCLSPPIEIRAGEVITPTIRVWGAMPNTNQGPTWTSSDVEGTYRLVLGALVHDYTTIGQSFGQPVPLEFRVSNEFTLRR